ncbi:MAG TPA: DUF418 domain-containing protein [Polyangiaceae bacterium]|nr:DUF418 domain-containing protein [Polyangiaceae bacterium]
MSSRLGPTAPRDRIDDIDVLRGMALCGVLLSNLLDIFRMPWSRTYHVPNSVTIDVVVDEIMLVVFSGNTITLTFAMLFGLGMAISSERMFERGTSAYPFLVRKQIALLALGLVHATLIWNGDILVSYAFLGLVVLPLLRRSPRTAVCAALALAIVDVLPIYPARLPFMSDDAESTARAVQIYGHGTWMQVQAQRFHDLLLIWRDVALRYFAFTAVAFCLGIAIWRSGFFAHLERRTRILRGLALGGIPSLAFIFLASHGYIPRPHAAFILALRRLGYTAAFLALSFSYCAGILLLLRTTFWRPRLLLIAPLGRMALSNYIMQSILFGFVFYGYGLGQYGKWPSAITAVFGLFVYALQVAYSHLWLRYFKFGPFEWLWRTLSYGEMQPFRNDHAPAAR